MILRRKLQKKAQFETFLIAAVTLFMIGVIIFFFNHLSNEIYDGFDDYFEDSDKFNNSEAHTSITDIQSAENSSWDYAFLAIFIGFIIQIVLFSFATRINIAFFWLLVILDIPVLIVAVVLSNIWQSLAENAVFATTITRFPITNAILGTYYPLAITAIFLFGMIAIFGKPPGAGGDL